MRELGTRHRGVPNVADAEKVEDLPLLTSPIATAVQVKVKPTWRMMRAFVARRIVGCKKNITGACTPTHHQPQRVAPSTVAQGRYEIHHHFRMKNPTCNPFNGAFAQIMHVGTPMTSGTLWFPGRL